MAQYKKNEVKDKIDQAAMEVFSKKGYQNTKIADIAEKAGISVGNVYRYYKSKEEILHELIPEDFFQQFQSALNKKVSSWYEGNESNYHMQADKEFFELFVEKKEQFSILIGGCNETKYENLKSQMINFMTDLFISRYAGKLSFDYIKNKEIIQLIYEKHFEMMVSIFKEPCHEEELKEKIILLNAYHVNGITSFIN